VLKARMMARLTTNVEQHAFATIWNACSEMGRYVQLGFPDDSRTKLFGTDWNSKPKNFDEIAQILAVGSVNSSAISLEKILNPATLFGNENDSDDKVEEFRTVINFPNFLLHVLRADKSDIPLDDKQLLKIFESIHIDPRTFAINLLECRMLFDRYIIHRKNEGEWGLMRLVGYAGKKGNVSYDDSFNSVQNPQIVMLLSMFHASFPTMTYKHWLSAALRFLITSTREQGSVNGADYIRWMETVSDRFLYGRFGENDVVDYFDLCLENQVQLPERINIAELNLGTNVQNFIFNRLDYLLWKRLSANEYFTGVQMDYIRSRWRKFSFTSRTSVEHYYPQQPLSGAPKLEKSSAFPTGCDTFGNLCLISPRSNSRLSNLLPEAKKEYIEKSGIVESLKQTFMISYPAWGPGAEASMLAHEQMMIDVLCARSSN
ncbi:MAG: HNH endonuclease, partial [Bacteroidetes bacterium]|nr:HNH endonuclease [Bacteroidota bacterium]